ncbi:type II secretion system protein GspG [Rhizobium wenxiniae]|uniref:Type II secretion system core protein G n=1 Tax=Rhizobium wenxiniae TaxID=1737357 RepID=A0A7W9YDE6_9HYPH|nr:type II secretion system major pseudopilin GspG [Rhizobium wenxiniae]MBB6166372.1 general secretion pathway protein G [Rhizobium wenxiniae]GGG23901.1 type II secretion system protein GspG [Rhizobium wenxiniae]
MQSNPQTISGPYRSVGSNEGFSLVELLVVLAIIGLIAAIATPQVLGYLDRAKVDTATAQINNFGNALEFYYLDAGTYPTSDQGLAALVKNPDNTANWNGPYIKDSGAMLDPWGTPYQYKSPGQSKAFEIISLGKDKKPGGSGSSADIVSK